MGHTERRDHGTDQRLTPLVGLVAVIAGTACVASLLGAADQPPTSVGQVATLLMVTVTIAISVVIKAPMRIRSTTHAITWAETAIVVGAAVIPAPWLVLATGVAIAVASVAIRLSAIKIVFSTSKNMLVAGSAVLVLPTTDWLWAMSGDLLDVLGTLAAVYLIAAVVDDLLAIPVIAVATGTPIRTQFRSNWDLRLAGFAVRFVVAACTAMILIADSRLLLAVPPLVLSLHLAYSAQVRARTEQQAWRRLAQATDALNVVDLDTVLTTAVLRAAELFSADEIEVEVTASARLVRGTGNTITYDGPAAEAPPTEGSVITARLEGYDRAVDVGSLRLRFRESVKLSERERYTLSTFASALCTAIRNATAYAELARAAEAHAYAAAHDTLTGLANRRELLDRGAEQLDQRHESGITALLLIDLNHFKEINDTLGHSAGDQVLIEVAGRLSGAATDGDLVARLGGDEFAVLFRGLTAPAMATYRSERLLAALREPLEVSGMWINVEASGGVAVAPSRGGMPELLRRADVAMYQAKRSGQRLVTYAQCRDTADLARLLLNRDVIGSISDYRIEVNFQPLVDLGSGEVVAAEALARWQHPEEGFLDPFQFLETVDRTDLLPAVADTLLEQAILAADIWRDAGFDLPVAVNVPPRRLLDARFPSSVLARLRAHGLPPDRLILELAEALTISQLEVVDKVLGRLSDEGVQLALDDFGTGHSSLSVLSRLPVHELKIDSAVVAAMETSAEAATVIRSAVDLGRGLNLAVVAEGVESEPQRRALWEVGCGIGQGHLFARPMPADRLLAALHRGSGGRPGTLAPPLHDHGAVIRLPQPRRANGRGRTNRLPHLPV